MEKLDWVALKVTLGQLVALDSLVTWDLPDHRALLAQWDHKDLKA